MNGGQFFLLMIFAWIVCTAFDQKFKQVANNTGRIADVMEKGCK